MRNLVLALSFLSFLAAGAHASEPARPAKLVLSQKAFAVESDPEFTCDGTVNGYITLPTPAVGRHQLEGVWLRPDGSAQERSVVTLDFSAPGRQTAQVWLRFNSGGVLSSLQEGESAGPSFDGDWVLQVRWDDKDLVQGKFKVRC